MKRYPAFDPPEYVDWTPDPDLVREFGERLRRRPERAEVVSHLSRSHALELYEHLLRTRLQDIALKRWVRQGVISKAWLGTGEEAVTVGSVFALDRDRDMVSPMIRNAGACPMMGMPLRNIFDGYLGTRDSPNEGRDLHIGDPGRGVIQPISHMGTNVPVMAGIALGFRNRGEDRVALTWIGDGATKTAACHEGTNFAAVQELPVVLVLQNNQIALGTRTAQHSAGPLSAWPEMYGIPAERCDGNNVFDVYAATLIAVERCRGGNGPAAVVAETFRMGGHATHDEREARETLPEELFQEWGRRDPIGLLEEFLVGRGIPREELERIEESVTEGVEQAAEEARRAKDDLPDPERARYEGISGESPRHSLELRPL